MELSCPLGTTHRVPQEKFPESHIINPLLTKLFRSRWLDIGLVLFFACLWTSTPSRSINTQKKNLVNIQPSWPHTWSITHTYCWRNKQGLFFTIALKVALRVPSGCFCSQRSKTKETDHFCIQWSEKHSRKTIAVLWLEIRQPKVKKWLSWVIPQHTCSRRKGRENVCERVAWFWFYSWSDEKVAGIFCVNQVI